MSISLSPSYTRKQVGTSVTLAIVAFLAYTSVYAYRKPFTVATYDSLVFAGIKYQTLLIICQGLGYMFSKFFGIRFIAELSRYGRWRTSTVLIGIAWVSLGVFALLPAPWGVCCLFINGFVLGFMWGIIFSYVEGRRATDFIGAVMAISFIFAGGFTRSVALWLRDSWQVSEQWLAFVTGSLFVAPLAALLLLLEKSPRPDERDVQERTQRQPMTGKERKLFIKHFGSGVIAVTVGYLFLTIMRDVRDNFMVNIFSELGCGSKPALFTQTETAISLVILLVMALLVFIRKNISALKLAHAVVILGFLLAGLSSFLFLSGLLNGLLWMQLVGLGLYLGYIPFNCIFFERLIAAFKITGNVGFLIYMVDAWGYLGSSAVMLSKEVLRVQLAWTQFYPVCVVVFSILGMLGVGFSWFYFVRKYNNRS